MTKRIISYAQFQDQRDQRLRPPDLVPLMQPILRIAVHEEQLAFEIDCQILAIKKNAEGHLLDIGLHLDQGIAPACFWLDQLGFLQSDNLMRPIWRGYLFRQIDWDGGLKELTRREPILA